MNHPDSANVTISLDPLTAETLRDSEAKYRILFNSMDEGFSLLELIFDEQGHVVDCWHRDDNPAFTRMTGIQDPVGKRMSELIPKLEAAWYRLLETVYRSGEPIRIDYPVEALGQWYTCYLSRMGGEGSPFIAAIYDDITERKRREADLAFLADISQDLAQLTDIDQTMDALGEKIGHYMGLSACVFGEIFGHNETQITEINHGWNRPDTPSLLGTYQMSEFMTLEMIHMCRSAQPIVIRDVFADPKTDGAQFAAINVGSFVGIPFVRDGDWRFLLVVYRSDPHDWSQDEIDLTRELMTRIWIRLERARAEEAALAREAEFRTITQAAPALVWVCSAIGENIYFNARWYEYTDQTPQQASGYGWTSTMHPEDAAYILPYWQRSQQTGEPYEGEVRYRRHDGVYRWHVFRALPRRNPAGQIQAWYGVSVDTDDARRAQEVLVKADRRKDEFLAMLAHELRNPLAPIRGGLQLLSLSNLSDSTLSALLPVMNRQMDHLIRMLDDLLDVSRISRGKIEIHPQEVDLAQLVAEAVEAMRLSYETADRQLHLTLPSRALMLSGDATRLQQVVSNLLTNGLRYTRDGGQVWVSLKAEGPEAVLRVRDNGIGLAADQLQIIFELFVQVDTALARPNKGLGLGLSLVQQLVTLHGGRVEAFSPGLDQGSEFVIHLPLLPL